MFWRLIGDRARKQSRLVAPLVLLLVACAEADRQPAFESVVAISVVDDVGHTVQLPHPARRVVSLVPSATETLFALGAADRVVGRTQYDEAPEAAHLPSVGGGLDPSLEALIELRPELVIAWDETKSPRLRERLEAAGIAVYGLRNRDTTDVFRTIERLGHLVGRDGAADSLAGSIRLGLDHIRASVEGRPRPSVFYIVWNDPPITAGPATFIGQIIEVAGGRTIFPDVGDWPTVALEEVVRRQPDVVIVPVGEARAHTTRLFTGAPGWRDLRAVQEGRVAEVPVNLMNRPGPHLAEAARVMRDAIHPEARPDQP